VIGHRVVNLPDSRVCAVERLPHVRRNKVVRQFRVAAVGTEPTVVACGRSR
jgi:hypothetical protein